MKFKSEWESQLATYVKRRNQYKRQLHNCSRQIERIQQNIKHNKGKEEQFFKNIKGLNEFFGENVKSSGNEKLLNICSYYCSFLFVTKYMAFYLKETPIKVYNRTKKGKRLVNKVENRELWQELTKYMKTYQE